MIEEWKKDVVARQFYRNVLGREDKCSSLILVVHELRTPRGKDKLTDRGLSVTRAFSLANHTVTRHHFGGE